jgi:hypothetical protein
MAYLWAKSHSKCRNAVVTLQAAGVHVHSFRWGRYYRVEAHDLTAAQMADVFATAQKPELAMLVEGL